MRRGLRVRVPRRSRRGLRVVGGVEEYVPCRADCVVEVVELHYEFWVVGGW